MELWVPGLKGASLSFINVERLLPFVWSRPAAACCCTAAACLLPVPPLAAALPPPACCLPAASTAVLLSFASTIVPKYNGRKSVKIWFIELCFCKLHSIRKGDTS